MPGVSAQAFISYRRDDAASEAHLLAINIRYVFGRDSVFVDTSDIPPGAKWPDTLHRALEEADVVLALMGPQWLFAQDEYGRRCIDDPEDWVYRELRLA